ncbi:hypothetical protein PYX06_00305 [Citrobacter amalonaticus]|nr:hypothetical protein [Citrobacter amalonaticus]
MTTVIQAQSPSTQVVLAPSLTPHLQDSQSIPSLFVEYPQSSSFHAGQPF